MTARQIRRAQRRQAAAQLTPEPQTNAAAAPPDLVNRASVNRANAQLSTGPTTPAGKATSSLNALKTGLTGRTVLLPGDDAARYTEHCSQFTALHQPVGPQEAALVQSLADTEWRLGRIPALEIALFALGAARFADDFANEAAEIRPGLIELQTYLVYEKQIRNLQIQESRMRRQRDKDRAELAALQKDRAQAKGDGGQLAQPAHASAPAPHPRLPECVQHAAGFEFSTQAGDSLPASAAATSLLPTLPPASSAHTPNIL
ncbi:MAG: hypothetical protein JO108_19440 [Acidobacteriaceae bacterium]|nr:hypothetical protein [Acidobacteriaceae bacterium]